MVREIRKQLKQPTELFEARDKFYQAYLIADRQEKKIDRLEKLFLKNEEVFKLAREDFFRRLIEAEINKEIQKNQQSKERRVKFGSDIVR